MHTISFLKRSFQYERPLYFFMDRILLATAHPKDGCFILALIKLNIYGI